MTAEEIMYATIDDEHLSMLSKHVLHGWPSMRAEIQKDLQQCWSFRDETVILDGIKMIGKKIIIQASLHGKC